MNRRLENFVVRGSASVFVVGVMLSGFFVLLLVTAAISPYEGIVWATYTFSIAALLFIVRFTILPYFLWKIKVEGANIHYRYKLNKCSTHNFHDIVRVEIRKVKKLKGAVQYIALITGENTVLRLDSTSSAQGFRLFAQRLEQEIAAKNIEVLYGRGV